MYRRSLHCSCRRRGLAHVDPRSAWRWSSSGSFLATSLRIGFKIAIPALTFQRCVIVLPHFAHRTSEILALAWLVATTVLIGISALEIPASNVRGVVAVPVCEVGRAFVAGAMALRGAALGEVRGRTILVIAPDLVRVVPVEVCRRAREGAASPFFHTTLMQVCSCARNGLPALLRAI